MTPPLFPPATLEPTSTTPVPTDHSPSDDARAEVVEAFEDLARTLVERLPANPYRYQVLMLLEQAGALARASFYFEEAINVGRVAPHVAPHPTPPATK